MNVIFQNQGRVEMDRWEDVSGAILPRIGERVVIDDAVYEIEMLTWVWPPARVGTIYIRVFQP